MSTERLRLRAVLDHLPAYVPGAPAPAEAYKLSSNENPYPPLPSVVEVLAREAVHVNRYPDMFATELTAAIAEHLGVDPEQVVTGGGSVAVLGHVLEVVAEPGTDVVVPWRSFEAYPIAVALSGATQVTVPVTADGRLDLAAMAAAVTERTRAVLVCTPNNPTGPAVHQDELDALLAAVPRDVLVLVDEAYVEFVRDPHAVDGLATLAAHPNVVLLRTFSKAYGLAGLRLGFAVAHAPVAEAIRKAATPFGVSHLAQRAGIASLAAADELLERVERIVAERGRMLAGLREAGLTVPESEANFVWLPLGEDAARFAAAAREAGIVVRPFAGDGVRVSVGEPEGTDILLDLVSRWS